MSGKDKIIEQDYGTEAVGFALEEMEYVSRILGYILFGFRWWILEGLDP